MRPGAVRYAGDGGAARDGTPPTPSAGGGGRHPAAGGDSGRPGPTRTRDGALARVRAAAHWWRAAWSQPPLPAGT